MSALHEVIGEIHAFTERLPAAEAAALKEQLQQAVAYLDGHAGNLQSPSLQSAVAMLHAAVKDQADVQAKIEGAKEAIKAVLNSLGLGVTGSGAVIAHPAVRESSPDPPASRPPARSFKEQAPEIARRLGLTAGSRKEFFGAALTVEQITDLLAQLPMRTKGATAGAWIGGTGRLEQIDSGEKDLAFDQAQQYWRVLWKRLNPTDASWQAPMASHAEVKAAIQMRAQDLKHRSMVINNADGPCGGDLGCQRTLDKFIPPGSTLTVYWPGGYKIFGGKE